MPIPIDDRRLLARHAPQLRYHPNEHYRADSAATFTDAYRPGHYSNELREAKTRRLIAQARPISGTARLSLAMLAPARRPYYPGGPKAKKGDYLLAHDESLREDWLAARALPGNADVVYCRIAEGKGRRWLQYWLFFYNNPYKKWGFGQHQGDWEWIQIAVVDGKPKETSYSQHGQCEPRKWEDVPTVGGAGVVPVVYIASGSHACYYEADKHLRIFGVANDHTADGGVVLRPTPYMLDDAVDRWIHWPGTWGASDSPSSPPHQLPWNDPEAFHAKKVKPGLFAGLEGEAVPSEPALETALAGDVLTVTFSVPPPRPGRSDPVRMELALYGREQHPVPSVVAVDVTESNGTVPVPLPYAAGPYTLHVAVYDAEGEELRLEPREVEVPRLAGLEAPEPPVLRPEPPGRPPIGPTAVRVVARAPNGDDDDRATLARALTAVDEFGASYRVEPLFADRDRQLRRFLTATGTPTLPPGMDVAAATFETARRLRVELPERWEVQPDPPSGAASPADQPEAAALSRDEEPFDWALTDMSVRGAWEVSAREGRVAKGAGIVIGQPDTGYTDHPELELDALDRLRDYDVLTGRDDAHAVLEGFPPAAFPSHGTGTASVAVSREPGDVTGSAPLARIVPIRAATSVIHIRNAELAIAVERAWTTGVDVITISMGGILYPPALRAVIKRAVNDGVIVMAAAGQFVGVVVWPARFAECLGVGGTARGHEPWAWSSRGREVDVSAPARDVWVAATRNEGANPYHVDQHDGTSFAVALTAGVAALWLAHHGGREAVAKAVGGRKHVQAAFRALARAHCTRPAGWDQHRLGAGIVNAEKLLAADLSTWRDVADTPPAPPTAPVPFALESVAAMAPEGVEPGAAKARVSALFDGDRGRLGEHSDELVYRLAEHRDVREAVFAEPGAGLEAAAAGRDLLRAVASPALREALG
jgi:Subtilase family